MENTFSQNINFEKYQENYNLRLIELCFKFFDSFIDKEQYEEEMELLITEFSEQKPTETKSNIKFLIDFIEKYANSDDKFLQENLESLSI
jgi:hypothetical protein